MMMMRSGHAHQKPWKEDSLEFTEFNSDLYNSSNFRVFEAVIGLKKKVQERHKETLEVTDNLFVNLRGYLILGRVLGVIPISGVFDSNYHSLSYKLISIPAIFSLVITSLLSFSGVLALISTIKHPKFNALDIAQSIQDTVFRLWGLFIYIYFAFRADAFINIFKAWARSSLYFPMKDATLRRDIIIISSLVFLAAACETCIIHLEYFPQFDSFNGMGKMRNVTRGESSLQTYYLRSHGGWYKYLGYHPFLAVMGFVVHKLNVAAWNYVDVLVILLSRALSFKFKALCEAAEKKLSTNEGNSEEIKPISIQGRLEWVHIVKDHDTLCLLVSVFGDGFLSPIIFCSYATNIYYVCMQLIDGLTPSKTDENIVYSIFAPVSFILLLVRMFLLSVNAARINTYAHEIGVILKRCPIQLYDSEVSRVDKHVTAGPDIGLTGLQCFTVTKPFLLSIINVVFTVEIVLLQGISNGGSCTTAPK